MDTEFWCGNLRERDHLEDPCIEESILLIWIFRKLDGGMERVHLAHEKDIERTHVNVVMNFWSAAILKIS